MWDMPLITLILFWLIDWLTPNALNVLIGREKMSLQWLSEGRCVYCSTWTSLSLLSLSILSLPHFYNEDNLHDTLIRPWFTANNQHENREHLRHELTWRLWSCIAWCCSCQHSQVFAVPNTLHSHPVFLGDGVPPTCHVGPLRFRLWRSYHSFHNGLHVDGGLWRCCCWCRQWCCSCWSNTSTQWRANACFTLTVYTSHSRKQRTCITRTMYTCHGNCLHWQLVDTADVIVTQSESITNTDWQWTVIWTSDLAWWCCRHRSRRYRLWRASSISCTHTRKTRSISCVSSHQWLWSKSRLPDVWWRATLSNRKQWCTPYWWNSHTGTTCTGGNLLLPQLWSDRHPHLLYTRDAARPAPDTRWKLI